jgi:hypothetical protein
LSLVAAVTKPATRPQQPTHAVATFVLIHVQTHAPTPVKVATLVLIHVQTHAQLATLVQTHAQLATSKSHFVTLPVHC